MGQAWQWYVFCAVSNLLSGLLSKACKGTSGKACCQGASLTVACLLLTFATLKNSVAGADRHSKVAYNMPSGEHKKPA